MDDAGGWGDATDRFSSSSLSRLPPGAKLRGRPLNPPFLGASLLKHNSMGLSSLSSLWWSRLSSENDAFRGDVVGFIQKQMKMNGIEEKN